MNKDRKIAENLSQKILKGIPLKTRLQIINEMFIQCFLVDNGYIPSGFWSDEKEEKYGKAFRQCAKELTGAQLKEIKRWEKDGRPK
jgi:hypothetical protein